MVAAPLDCVPPDRCTDWALTAEIEDLATIVPVSVPVAYYDSRPKLPGWAWRAIRRSCSHGATVLFKPQDQGDPALENLTIIDPRTLDRANQDVRAFRSIYRHRSSAPEAYEMACFERFLVLSAFMASADLSHVWHLDTDAFAAKEVRRLGPVLVAGGVDAVVSGASTFQKLGDAVSAGNSFLSRRAVESFSELLLERFYADLDGQLLDWWLERQQVGLSGGVCDMTAWGICLDEHPDWKVIDSNTCLVHGAVFINSSYVAASQWQAITSQAGVAVSLRPKGGEIEIHGGTQTARVAIAHFAGADKWLIYRMALRMPVRMDGIQQMLLRFAYRIKRRLVLSGTNGRS